MAGRAYGDVRPFNVAELIAAAQLDRARNAIRGLLGPGPGNGTRAPGRSAAGRRCPPLACAERHRAGAAGQRIPPTDGIIVSGSSAVDQSPPPEKACLWQSAQDDPVYAATVNASGSFEYRVTAAAGNTTLARIIHAVEQAQGARAPTQRFIDRFSRIYTPVVVGIAALVAVAPPLLWSQPWY